MIRMYERLNEERNTQATCFLSHWSNKRVWAGLSEQFQFRPYVKFRFCVWGTFLKSFTVPWRCSSALGCGRILALARCFSGYLNYISQSFSVWSECSVHAAYSCRHCWDGKTGWCHHFVSPSAAVVCGWCLQWCQRAIY